MILGSRPQLSLALGVLLVLLSSIAVAESGRLTTVLQLSIGTNSRAR